MIYLDDSEFTHRHSSIQRFTKLSEQEQSILEEVRGTMKCISCSKSSSKSYDKLIKLMKYGHAVCKEYFKMSKNQRCQQDNCNKAIDRKEFDKFQIIAVMEAKYDVELIKALECVACFEIFNLAANNPRQQLHRNGVQVPTMQKKLFSSTIQREQSPHKILTTTVLLNLLTNNVPIL